MQFRIPDPQRISSPRRFVQLVVVTLAAGAILAGCFLFRSKSEPAPTAEVGGVRATPSAQEKETPAGAVQGRPPTPRIGAGTVAPTRQALPGPQVVASAVPDRPLLTVDVPNPGQSIYSPVYVRGSGTVPFERALEAQVLSVGGEVLGRGPILFDPVAPFGEKAVYEGTLPFRQPEQQQLGSVRVLMRSPRDSSIVDYAQVLVVLLPAGSGPEDIMIDTPAAGAVIGNPVHVEGTAVAPQNQITIRLKAGPAVLVADTIPLAGEIGEPGRFSVDLSYKPFPASVGSRPGYPAPSESVAGYIEVFYRSPKDGRIAQIASVPVVIPGASEQ